MTSTQSLRSTAQSRTGGTFRVDGLTCTTGEVVGSGAAEKSLLFPQHHVFGAVIGGRFDDEIEESWDGRRLSRKRNRSESDTLLVPRGTYFISKSVGSFSFRNVRCELDPLAFERSLGDRVREVELRPFAGANPIMAGVVERLAAIARAPNDFSLAYAESLSTVLAVELFLAYGTRAIPPPLRSNVGSARFALVFDYVEEALDREIGLFELAELVGLSVTHFAHAFKATYGIAPYRYILQRRIERAQALLRTTNDTISTIAGSVGFSSQSSFGQTFARFTGATPSEYRAHRFRR